MLNSNALRRFAIICALPALMAAPAAAKPTIGLGLSVSFGGGQVNTGVGVRVFSDNRRNRAVGALGLDYMFGSQSWRGTVGAAYLGSNSYIGLDLGIGLGTGAIDFGIGAGAANTKRRPAAAVAPLPPVVLEPLPLEPLPLEPENPV